MELLRDEKDERVERGREGYFYTYNDGRIERACIVRMYR